MSAFIVGKPTIDAIVEYALNKKLTGYAIPTDPNELGNALWEENYKSVNHRYEINDETEKYTFAPYHRSISYPEFMKLLKCLDYQSCEHDGYENSKAYKYIRELCWMASPEDSQEYRDAPWGVDE